MANGKHLFRAVAEEVWHRGNLAFLRHAYSPAFLGHTPLQQHQSLADYRAHISTTRLAFPDVHIEVLGQLAEGDRVATHYRVRGTHAGEYMGLEPTGRSISVEGITIQRLTHGRISESWASWDALGLLTELQAPRAQPRLWAAASPPWGGRDA